MASSSKPTDLEVAVTFVRVLGARKGSGSHSAVPPVPFPRRSETQKVVDAICFKSQWIIQQKLLDGIFGAAWDEGASWMNANDS